MATLVLSGASADVADVGRAVSDGLAVIRPISTPNTTRAMAHIAHNKGFLGLKVGLFMVIL
ncbi:hypothetical protein [Moraxella lacunata]|uniref:hypothetical protein n=1 Tax=Moraxella lacunata TaxID=477 RepID=UPI003EE1C60A